MSDDRKYCDPECRACWWGTPEFDPRIQDPFSPAWLTECHGGGLIPYAGLAGVACPKCGRVLLPDGETLPMATPELVADAARYRTLVAIMDAHGAAVLRAGKTISGADCVTVTGLHDQSKMPLLYGRKGNAAAAVDAAAEALAASVKTQEATE